MEPLQLFVRPRWQRILRIPLATYRLWRLGRLSLFLCLRIAAGTALLKLDD